jgi:hypothetical protein
MSVFGQHLRADFSEARRGSCNEYNFWLRLHNYETIRLLQTNINIIIYYFITFVFSKTYIR